MHTSDADSDGMEGLEEEFYVVSRGDFSGSPRVEETGGEPWTPIPPASPPPATSTVPPEEVTPAAGYNQPPTSAEATSEAPAESSTAGERARPTRKMSVTELVSKLDYEEPKTKDKRLPVYSPQERAQRATLARHMHNERRVAQEEELVRQARGPNYQPRPVQSYRRAVDGFVFPDTPVPVQGQEAVDEGMTAPQMPGSFTFGGPPPLPADIQGGNAAEGRTETWWYGGEHVFEVMVPQDGGDGGPGALRERRRQAEAAAAVDPRLFGTGAGLPSRTFGEGSTGSPAFRRANNHPSDAMTFGNGREIFQSGAGRPSILFGAGGSGPPVFLQTVDQPDVIAQATQAERGGTGIISTSPARRTTTRSRRTVGDRSEWIAQRIAAGERAQLQINEIRRRRAQEQAASGQPVEAASASQHYTIDAEGNVLDFTEGPTRRFRVLQDRLTADGSYIIEEELPPPIEPEYTPAPAPTLANQLNQTNDGELISEDDVPRTPAA